MLNRTLFSFLLFISAVHADDSLLSKWIWKHYGRNIVYQHFENIRAEDWTDVPAFPLPSNLYRDLLHYDGTPDRTVGNSSLVRQYVEAELKRFNGMTLSETKRALTPKEIVRISVTISSRLFSYEDVENPSSSFYQKMGKDLPLDRYIFCGQGDCDKFSAAAIQVFKLLKSDRKDMRNMFLTQEIAARSQRHSWNALVLFTNKQVIITHLDPTFLYGGSSDDVYGKDDFHYFNDSSIHASKFYLNIRGFSYAKTILMPLIEEDEADLSSNDLSIVFNDLMHITYYANDGLTELRTLRDKYKLKQSAFDEEDYSSLEMRYYFNAIQLAVKLRQLKMLRTLCNQAKGNLAAAYFHLISDYCR